VSPILVKLVDRLVANRIELVEVCCFNMSLRPVERMNGASAPVSPGVCHAAHHFFL